MESRHFRSRCDRSGKQSTIHREKAWLAIKGQAVSELQRFASLEWQAIEVSQHVEQDGFAVGAPPEQIVNSLIAGTKLADPAVRKQLYQGGEAAIENSTDPLIVLMRSVDTEARAVRKRFEDEVDSVERSEGPKIARKVFRIWVFRTARRDFDASTHARSYGKVRGYSEDGKSVPYFTDIRGAFQYANEHDNKPPYKPPESWIGARNKIALATPLDFVSTADVLGGNSGSPVLNRSGQIVGVVFDGNSQALASNFM